jgi:CheY-like chemotaxis protein
VVQPSRSRSRWPVHLRKCRESGTADAGEGDRLDGIRVLVVDDQVDERELLRAILTARGAEVDMAESAAAALAKITRRPPTVLVTDVAMPGQDGYALLRGVRLLPGAPRNLPAIAVTAHAQAEDRSRALSAGFQAYISKPIEHA